MWSTKGHRTEVYLCNIFISKKKSIACRKKTMPFDYGKLAYWPSYIPHIKWIVDSTYKGLRLRIIISKRKPIQAQVLRQHFLRRYNGWLWTIYVWDVPQLTNNWWVYLCLWLVTNKFSPVNYLCSIGKIHQN